MDQTTPAGIRASYKAAFLKGLATILPTVLTIYVLLWAFSVVDGNIATPINNAIKGQLATGWGRQFAVRHLEVDPSLLAEGREDELAADVDRRYPTWLGFGAAIVLCFLVGFFIASFVGRKLWAALERWFSKMPVIRAIYPSAKQVTEFFISDGSKENQFSRVGFVPFPTEGQWAIGFVMSEGFQDLDEARGRRHLPVFVPMAPTPVTGFVVFVPEEHFHGIDMSVDEAFKFYVTAGLAVPERLRVRRAVLSAT